VLGLITLLASTAPPVAPYLLGSVLGFLLAAFGHLIKAPLLILFGIVVIGLTSALFVIVAGSSFS
jgi:hypothetical protein